MMWWRNRDLVSALVGETISDLGSQIGDLALPLLAWIDRIRRRPVLVATNLVRCAVLLGVGFAAAANMLTVEALYAVALVFAGLDVVFTSTFAAYVPTLVAPGALISANGARATSSAAADVIGPAIADGLISLFGAPLAILAGVGARLPPPRSPPTSFIA